MHIVKSVGVMSVAKIMGMIYGCIALIFVPFFLIIGVVGSMVGSMAGRSNNPFAGIFGIILAIFMPVIWGVWIHRWGARGAALQPLCQMGGRLRIRIGGQVNGFDGSISDRPTCEHRHLNTGGMKQ